MRARRSTPTNCAEACRQRSGARGHAVTFPLTQGKGTLAEGARQLEMSVPGIAKALAGAEKLKVR